MLYRERVWGVRMITGVNSSVIFKTNFPTLATRMLVIGGEFRLMPVLFRFKQFRQKNLSNGLLSLCEYLILLKLLIFF